MGLISWPGQAVMGLTSLRRSLYDHQWMKSRKVDCPVISIGNLTFGGTGKTPIIDFLLQEFEVQKKNIAVVSRTYKIKNKSYQEVNLGAGVAQDFGDEPYLLKRRHPQVRIFVGPKKVESAFLAFAQAKPSCILIDDGFQHLQLYRDLDCVLLDATKPVSEYQPFPVGRAREGLASLSRAHCVFLTKCNAAPSENLESLKTYLPSHLPVFEFDYVFSGFRGGETTKDVALISGIGDPKSFERMMSQKLNVTRHLVFEDHAPFDRDAVVDVLKEIQASGAKAAVTTEKDMVKLENFLELFKQAGVQLAWAEMNVSLRGGEKKLEELRGILGSVFKS